MYRKVDYTGKRFGKWTVTGIAQNHITKGGYPVSMWECVCDCGTKRAVRGNDLRLGKSVSCGCSMVENPSARKHGATGTHLYMIYHGIKARCLNKNNKNYKHYGGRGIKICKEWDEYESFEAWALSSGYQSGLTLDRIDVNGDYCPENCKWITQREQTRNKRTTIFLTAFGETKPLVEWAEQYNMKYATLRKRIKRGMSTEEALTAKASLPKMEDMTDEK